MDKHFYIKFKDEKMQNSVRRILFFIAPLILLLSLEVMHISHLGTLTRFFATGYFVQKLILSYVFLLATQCLFYTLTQSSFYSNLINTILMFGLVYASETLSRVNGNPLLPTDLLLFKNIKEIATFAEIPFFVSGIVALVMNVVSLVVHWKVCRNNKKRIRPVKRIAFGIVALLVFSTVTYAVCISAEFKTDVLTKNDVAFSAFNPIEDYYANGPVLNFFPRIGEMITEKPENYNEETISSFKTKYEPAQSVEKDRKVNIIIIQNEAWWNPALLKNVNYSVDLMSGINSLTDNVVRGTFVTPVYAGGTCLPEFEVLTGIPMLFMPSSVYPYTQYVTHKTPSIVSAYKDNGYQTIALHPYRKNFYNRSTAYPLLGFETFKGMNEFDYKDVSGIYIDDMACVKQIIKEFENKTADRIFEFVVTMENHGTYTLQRYDKFDFEMEAETLTEEEYMDLKRYSQGVYNADKAFMALVEYFKNVDEPVLIAMYGDHLPLLGDSGSTLMNGGLIEKTEKFVVSEYTELFETPYVVWTNYDKPSFNLSPKVSGNTFGLKLFLASGCDAPWHFNIMNELCKKYPVLARNAIIDAENEYSEITAEDKANIVTDFKLLMYDILNGKNYVNK